MDLICYLHPGWAPLIRPAPATRAWMDTTPEAFAYRCLPLNIANAHGWEVLCPVAFDAHWNGGSNPGDVTIRLGPDARPERAPVALFGQGVITFHIEAIFRTPPGWNLWVGGSPNQPKDGVSPLTGVIETDWSPFTFTMNWRFTRPDCWVHFDAGEPICFLFPVQRGALDAFEPRLEPIASETGLSERFTEWSQARDAFHAQMAKAPPATPADKWQKHYYRGVDVRGRAGAEDHQAKLRLKPFDASATPGPPAEALARAAAQKAVPAESGRDRTPAVDRGGLDLRKREWLLEATEAQRQLSPATAGIERRGTLTGEEFLQDYYATSRPVILTEELADWPALSLWTPDYLRRAIGSAVVEYQGARAGDEHFEMNKDAHRRELPFDKFIDLIVRPGAGNDAYLTAYNSARNAGALAPLNQDTRFLDKFLTREAEHADGMMWIGPAGTTSSLHHDLTNNLIAQVVGRKRLILVPAAHVGRLYNHQHVFSEITDLEGPGLDPVRFSRLSGVHAYEVILEPGEILYVPLAWWHQVKALDFSVTLTFTNFKWPNDGYKTYPSG